MLVLPLHPSQYSIGSVKIVCVCGCDDHICVLRQRLDQRSIRVGSDYYANSKFPQGIRFPKVAHNGGNGEGIALAM